jgi:hypothetical protein
MDNAFIAIAIFVILSLCYIPMGRFLDKSIGKQNYSGPFLYIIGLFISAIIYMLIPLLEY